MATRLPPRHKSGPRKGQFKKRAGSSKKKSAMSSRYKCKNRRADGRFKKGPATPRRRRRKK